MNETLELSEKDKPLSTEKKPQQELSNQSSLDSVARKYQSSRIAEWNTKAKTQRNSSLFSKYYHQRLLKIYQELVPAESKVLELGCAKGDLLAGLNPSLGVGVDFSPNMVEEATNKYPHLKFINADAHEFDIEDTFDYIILSDLINDLWDMQGVLEKLSVYCHNRTRIILNNYSKLWELPLRLANRLHLGQPQLQKNWLAPGDVKNLLDISGYKTIREWEEILLPLNIPFITTFFNRFLVKLWPISFLGLTNFTLARPALQPTAVDKHDETLTASIIIPARNESGHIEELFKRLPDFGINYELIFVEGNSNDDTYSVIESSIKENGQLSARLLQQTGRGKKDAVVLGISQSKGQIITILDADLSVAPEDLPKFINVIKDGRGEFANGVRMVYPQERNAMRFINLFGNKLFAWILSQLLAQRIGDSLCGTKVFWRKDYDAFTSDSRDLGEKDPFGDFTLLFGAARLNLDIVDVPVRYRARAYGVTNIRRWQDGWKLLKVVTKSSLDTKFI